MKRRHAGSPRLIGDIVHDFVREAGFSGKSALSRAKAAWPDVVGKEIAAHTKVSSLRKGTLSVAVDSAPHLYELVMLKGEEIRKALNKTLRPSTILKINFHLNEVK